MKPAREDRIYEEAAALWRALYGEPPPHQADGASMLDLITRQLPAPKYDRLAAAQKRSSSIAFPKGN